MRVFLIICFSSLAFAAPQGYNYAVSSGSSGAPLLGAGAFQAVSALEPPVTNFGSYSGSTGYASSGGSGFASGIGGGIAGGYIGAGAIGGGFGGTSGSSGYQSYAPQQPIVSKRFFIHSAPEEADEGVQERTLTIGRSKKNYNVVFIKAPSKSVHRTKLRITPAVNEEKTVIYVLNKKGEQAQVDAQVLEHATTTAKPEVFFIKYKTNEEAEHAQRTIQSQYDSYGGSTQIINEGYAPVSSVIGSLDGGKAADVPGNTYLPPGKYRN